MPRAPSIPAELAPSILSRWTNGQSAGQIVEWIHGTNQRRKEPTMTTKSSIQRFIERYSSTENVGSTVPIVRHCRANAWKFLDGLDDIEADLRACVSDSSMLDDSRGASLRFNARLRSLANLERNLFRRLKLAGVDGRADIAELEKNPAVIEYDRQYRADAANDLALDDVAEPDGKSNRFDSGSTGETCEKEVDDCEEESDELPPDFDEDEPAWWFLLDAKARRIVRMQDTAYRAAQKEGHQTDGEKSNRIESASAGKTSSIQSDACAIPKVGRNAPCPCGSGAKFKRCCSEKGALVAA